MMSATGPATESTAGAGARQDRYETVVGLEVHAQLRTESKIFCGCSTKFGARPNTQVCPVCLGLPGVLPVLNERAVRFAVMTGLAVGAKVAERSVFARKNYFYPDLPKGYQISQYDRPLCIGGGIEIRSGSGWKRIGLVRIHLEEDAGKSLHPEGREGVTTTRVDLNRSGVPLIEIVSEPEIRSVESGGRVVQETLLWNADKGIAETMRSKEEAHDYRYFPEPDLLPLDLDPAWIESVRSELPELPRQVRDRLTRELGIPE